MIAGTVASIGAGEGISLDASQADAVVSTGIGSPVAITNYSTINGGVTSASDVSLSSSKIDGQLTISGIANASLISSTVGGSVYTAGTSNAVEANSSVLASVFIGDGTTPVTDSIALQYSTTGPITLQSPGTLVLTATKSTVVGGLVSSLSSGSISSDFTDGSELLGNAKGNVSVALNASSVWYGSAIGANAVAIDGTSAWNVPASSSVASLNLSGRVNFTPGSIGRTLTVGTFAGNGGTATLNTVLGGDNSPTDSITVTAAATGTTHLDIMNAGGKGAMTKKGIEVVAISPSATVSSTAFDMPAGVIDVGLFDYSLKQEADRNYYLVSSPTPQAVFAPDSVLLPEAYSAGVLGSYLDRAEKNGQMWVNTFAQDVTVDPSSGGAGKMYLYAAQGGLDVLRRGGWHVGLFGGGGTSELAANGGGGINGTDFSAAVYANTSGRLGWVEFIGQETSFTQTMNLLGSALKSSGSDLLGSVEFGRDFQVGSLSITLIGRFIMQQASINPAIGKTLVAAYSAPATEQASLGIRAAYSPRQGALLWLKLTGADQFGGQAEATLSNGGGPLSILNDMNGTSAVATAGAEIAVGRGFTAFGSAGYEGGQREHGLNFNLGLRHNY